MNIVVSLDSVKKYGKSKTEYQIVPRASTTYNGESYEVVGYGAVVKGLLAVLVEKNCDIKALVHVVRGDTPVFSPCPIKDWLGLDNDGNKLDKRPQHLRGGQDG